MALLMLAMMASGLLALLLGFGSAGHPAGESGPSRKVPAPGR
jgi:hypothetical protein